MIVPSDSNETNSLVHMGNRTSIKEFWSWFVAHRIDVDVLTDSDSPFWDVVLDELKKIDEHLWFEMSRPNGNDREFIVTAEGHKELFPVVDQMVSLAPHIEGWQFFALIPSRGFDFEMTYEGLTFAPCSMWFLPLESRSRPQEFGIRVGIPNYNTAIERQAKHAVLIILDNGLGERSSSIDVQFVDIAPLPEDPDFEGYLELTELPRYIEWRKRTRPT